MHALFRMRYGFPLHRNLRPIFVSFHCNKRDLLTADAIEYLKRYGPVGCRDWTTVYLLLSVGVPAFFSGCLTTTISTVFPDLDERPPADAPVGYVDVPADASRPARSTYRHSRPAPCAGARSSRTATTRVDLLETYRRDRSAVVTSRLHCLPAAALDRRRRSSSGRATCSDIRFDGLIGIDDAAFDAIRARHARASSSGSSARSSPARSGGRGLRPLARAHRRRRRRGRGPAARRRPAPGGAAGRPRRRRSRPRSPRRSPSPASEPARRRGGGALRRLRDEVGKCGRLAPLVRSLVAGTDRPLHVWVLGRPKARADPAQRWPGPSRV